MKKINTLITNEKENEVMETNMEKIKSMSKFLLSMDINKTDYWPMIAQHPFTNSGSFCWRGENGEILNGTLEKGTVAYDKWKEQYTSLIDSAKTVFEISFFLNEPWRLLFVKLIEPYLSIKDFTSMLKEAFMESEHPNMDPNVSISELKYYFKKCGKAALMEEDEQEVYDSLPDTVTVYRGVNSYNNKNIKRCWNIK